MRNKNDLRPATPAPTRDPVSLGYYLLVRRSLGRGSEFMHQLHRMAVGKTRLEAAHEAELFERELNQGLTFAEAEARQIAHARVKRDAATTSAMNDGVYFVAIHTVHQASQMPGFEQWGKRKTPRRPSSTAKPKKAKARAKK